MLKTFVKSVQSLFAKGIVWFERKLRTWTPPALPSLVLDTLGDLRRDKSELVKENALLRQQLIVMKRSVEQPKNDRYGSTNIGGAGQSVTRLAKRFAPG